ncbi:MAG TPA: OmpA family protein [Cyclobacteriaceae bacterium]
MDKTNLFYKFRFYSIILFCNCYFGSLVFAQVDQVKTDTSSLIKPLEIVAFKNINKVTYYQNNSDLRKIERLNRQKKWQELYDVLIDYISNFGIQNFYKDTHLIWKLAKLVELLDDAEKAKPLYRLVLKHHHEGINLKEIELYYDSLNEQAKDIYVPIDYYYELVEHRKTIDTLKPPHGVLLNMGGNINSKWADYGPSMSINDKQLIFTSKRNQIRRQLNYVDNEDVFTSYKIGNNYWSESKPVIGINSRYNEGSPCMSRDGKKIYFSRCDCPNCYGDCDLFVAEMDEDSTWTNIENLGINVNSVGWDSHPSLSHSEDTLFFASDRIGGFGLSDIYFTYKTDDGEWSPARNIGPIINTRNNDVSPFYHPTHHLLYFSSNGQLYNFGEYDIFKVYRQNGTFTEPMNIGPLVNGMGSEFYFTIDSRSTHLFYARSSTRNLNRLDLYSFPLPMEAQPGAVISVTGTLTDSLTGKPFKGIVSIIDLDEGIEIAPKFLKADGSFEFKLINQRNYLLVIQGDDFFRIEEVFYLDGPAAFNKVTEPIASKVKFESIAFDVGKAQLKEAMYADLNKIVNFMYDNPDFQLRILGHTDDVGSPAYNLKLSENRARNIYRYMVEFGGVEPERISYKGFGSTKPIIEKDTEEARKINRRVEFEIYRPALNELNTN